LGQETPKAKTFGVDPLFQQQGHEGHMWRCSKLRVGILAIWLGAAGLGTAMISEYQYKEGVSGVAPDTWPEGLPFGRDSHRHTLIVVAHPKCSCTRATFENLNRLLARCGGRVAVRVLFIKPDGLSRDWTRTDLWRSAAAIPGVVVGEDPDGAIARKFGAETSGYALLYDGSGRLEFHGGLTDGRAHAGDNSGADSVVSLVNGGIRGAATAPVFGCSLLEPKCQATAAPR
jgi:hypothetical protein